MKILSFNKIIKLILVNYIMILTIGCSFNPNKPYSNTGVRGLLICEKTEICPIITVIWDENNRDILNIDIKFMSIYQTYDINRVVFSDNIKKLSFDTISPTKIDFVLKSNRSRNNILVPVDIMRNFKNSNNIFMEIYTDKGVIKRYLIKDNVTSSVFDDFNKYY